MSAHQIRFFGKIGKPLILHGDFSDLLKQKEARDPTGIRCAFYTDCTCWKEYVMVCSTDLHTPKIPSWHLGPCLADSSCPGHQDRGGWQHSYELSQPQSKAAAHRSLLLPHTIFQMWWLAYAPTPLGVFLSFSVPSSPIFCHFYKGWRLARTVLSREQAGAATKAPEQVISYI